MLDAHTFKERLLESGLATAETLLPVSPEEVHRLEVTSGIMLPNDYKAFLLTAGKCAGVFMEDCTFFYPEIMGLNENAKKMLAAYEGSSLVLPGDAFVFLDRQEQFLFFHGNSHQSGTIYRYLEDAGSFAEWSPTFWQFVADELAAAEDLIQKHPEPSFWNDARERALARVRGV
jgi:hypothetical protein